MKIFAISDLHLSFGTDKPMDIFGEQWEGHAEKIEENWRAVVGPDDWVLMGGDLSWATDLDEVEPDLEFVHSLPGEKLMIKGNHAHWWSGPSKVRAILPPSIRILNYDSYVLPDGTCIVGTRGWNPPGRSEGRPYSDQDRKIYERELGRFELSLKDSDKKRKQWDRRWALIHYPPRYSWGLETGFVPLMQEAEIGLCVYGHLHGKDHRSGFVGEHDGIEYVLAACDYTDMELVLLDEVDEKHLR
jgi:predicted phosphohydrolase